MRTFLLFLFAVLFSLPAAAQESCVDAPDGLIGWWPGDGDAQNLIQGGIDGTLMDGATFDLGKVGQGFSLDESLGAYVNIGTYNSGPEATVEAWVQTIGTAPPDFQAIVSSTALNQFVHMQLLDGGIGNNVAYTDGGIVFLPIIPATTGTPTWRHVAMTVKSGDSRLYVDGDEVGGGGVF